METQGKFNLKIIFVTNNMSRIIYLLFIHQDLRRRLQVNIIYLTRLELEMDHLFLQIQSIEI